MRRTLLLALLFSCAPAHETEEPLVRVWLRSLGDGPFEIAGKGGIAVDGAAPVPGPVKPGREARFAAPGGVVTVNGHAYSGELEWRDKKLLNRVPMENYVLGVLRGELPLPDVPAAAAAAQAIAVRSYTLFYLAKGRRDFDVDDTTLYQRYVGLAYAPDDAHLREGVQSTRGLVLELGGKPLKAYYHSTCGGHTADVATGLNREKPIPLVGVACDHCRASKYYRWEAVLPADAVLKAAGVRGPLSSFEVTARGPGGRALRVRINDREMHAAEFRSLVGPSVLRSTNILSARLVPSGVLVEGGGWGHGVGLCQMGAIGLAKEGKSGREIAAYYYPVATLRRAW